MAANRRMATRSCRTGESCSVPHSGTSPRNRHLDVGIDPAARSVRRPSDSPRHPGQAQGYMTESSSPPFSVTDGSSAMFTHTCTCGWPR